MTVITFDLWDTVFIDDSDEPKRAAQGLATKYEARRALAIEAFSSKPAEQVRLAYDAIDAAFRKVWHESSVTWTVKERVALLCKVLGEPLSEEAEAKLISGYERMELDVRPDFAAGIHEALAILSKKYRLGVISDAIVTPGSGLRELLEGEDLLKYFEVFSFSDEVGASKPAPAIFEAAAEGFGVEVGEIIHIGDRESNDIVGPHLVGARSILTTVAKDRGSENTEADAICRDYGELVGIIDALAKG